MVRSSNIFRENDCNQIEWETLPKGDVGILPPENSGPIAEENSFTTLSDGMFFTVFRTVAGYPGCAYSRE